MTTKETSQEGIAESEGSGKPSTKKLPTGVRQDCHAITADGTRCNGRTYLGRDWCNSHSPNRQLKKEKYQIGDYDPGPIDSPDKIAEVIRFVVQSLFADKLKIDKSRAIMEALKQQLVVLNEIYKRSPEGRERSLDQVTKMMIIVQGLSPEKAAELLNSKDFLDGVQREVERRDLQADGGDVSVKADKEIEEALKTLLT